MQRQCKREHCGTPDKHSGLLGVKELGSKGVKTIVFDCLTATLSPCSQSSNVSIAIVCTPACCLPPPKYTLNYCLNSCTPALLHTVANVCTPELLYSWTPNKPPGFIWWAGIVSSLTDCRVQLDLYKDKLKCGKSRTLRPGAQVNG